MKQFLLKTWLTMLCLLVFGSGTMWGDTKTGSWDLTSSSSDWTASLNETYFSQPYGYKKANGTLTNKSISDFSTTGISQIKVGFKCLQNGETTSKLTIYLVDKDGKTLGNGVVVTPDNKSAASQTTYKYATFTTNLTGATGFMMKVTTFGKNILINGAEYEVTYTSGGGSTPDPEPTNYTVTVANNIANGTVTASPTSAIEGTEVTLTATPASGYEFGSWNVTNATTSAAITVTNNKFTMPAANVNVSATFNAIPTHEAKFFVNGQQYGETQSVAEGSAITFPTNKPADIEDKKFVGWFTSEYSHATNAPAFVTSATMGTQDVNYYAVFATAEGGKEVETMSQTLQYDTWTYSGSTTDKSSYRLFHSGSYIESESFDRSKLSKVVVYGGTFGGDSYNKLTIGDGTNTWKSVTVSGSSQTGKNTYTDGTTLSGTGSIRITSNSGSASSNGVRISKVEIYTKEGGYTYTDYCTTVSTKTLTTITVKNAPTKVTYTEDEMFDPAGLVITATYDDESTEDIAYATNAPAFTFSPSITTSLTPSNTEVQITYNEKTCSQAITVNAIPTYTLTITQPKEGGTLTVKNGETQLENGANVRIGTNLTCEVTNIPEGKRFSRFYAKWGEEDGELKYKGVNPSTFDNIATENITACEIYVTYMDIKYYTINYIINGVNTNPQENVEENTPLTFPEAPTSIAGQKFQGWVEEAIEGTTDDAPTFVSTQALIASANKTYYAVYAIMTGTSDPNVLTSVSGAITSGNYYLVDTYDGVDANNNTAPRFWAVNGGLNGSNGTTGGFNSLDVSTYATEENGTLSLDLTGVAPGSWPTLYSITINDGSVSISKGDETYYCNGTNVNADMSTSPTDTYNWNRIVEGIGDFANRYSIEVDHGTGQRCLLFQEHTGTPRVNRQFKNQLRTNRGAGGGQNTASFSSGYFYLLQAGDATYSDYTTFVGYTRNVTNGNLGTVCVPCDVPAEGIKGAKFYSIAGKRVDSEGLPTSVVFEEVDELEAGVPYIFLAEADAISLSYSGDAAETASNAGGLYGTFEDIDFADDMDDYSAHAYYIINKTKIQKASSKSGVDANRAFIKMDQVSVYGGSTSNRMLVVGQNGFDFEEGTLTNIQTIETIAPSAIYDLQGRRVINAKSGMYIVKGKKVIQ